MTRSSTPSPGGSGAPERSAVARLALPIAVAVVIVIAAVAAIALTGSTGDGSVSPSPSAASTPIASGAASTPQASAAAPSAVAPSGEPVISGTPLPLFTQSAGDPAIGQTIPTVEGADFAGAPVSISLDGKPKVILFLAHWCAHCQREVPLMQEWLDGGGAPDGVELISVATAIDPGLPNYPPEEWLAREGWTVPVIVDKTGTVATAYGLSAFPFWVFVHADGTVLGRVTGELTIADLQTIIASLQR